ncbi:tetratricopeptide repeat protein, partial [Candidatus Sumerlaeota bacterium]|nr:tetratricopeptide repeat protein [Candidatus Sumerlaeota bacterium]
MTNPSPAQASNSRAELFIRAATILALLLIAYQPLLRAGFIWDDDDYVTKNPTLLTARGLYEMWFVPRAIPQYYPLVHTTFWIERSLWGLNPLGFHFVNLALHALNALLVWPLLQRLRVRGAWLAAAIFALHPVHAESVAWITERKNVLSGAFYLLAFHAYLRFLNWNSPGNAKPHRRLWGAYALALFLYACALFSKTVTSTLPIAILIVIWWKRGRIAPRDFMPLVPMFLLGAALSLVTISMERHFVGTERSDFFNWSRIERALTVTRTPWFYLGKLILPFNLSFFYAQWEIHPASSLAPLFPPAMIALLAALWLRRARWGRGPLAAILFFGVTLGPALGFIDVAPMRFSIVADHFQYLASLGVIVLAAPALAGQRFIPARLKHLAGGVIALLLALLTWHQAHIYENQETLWRDTLRKAPGSWIAHTNLGVILANQRKYEEALDHFKSALDIKPKFALVDNHAGTMLLNLNRATEAEPYFLRALELAPKYEQARINLGLVYDQLGKRAEAMDCYRRAIEDNP